MIKKINHDHIELKKENKSMFLYQIQKDVVRMNTHYLEPDYDYLLLTAQSMADGYFIVVGQNKDHAFKWHTKKQTPCFHWTKETKEKYKVAFLEHHEKYKMSFPDYNKSKFKNKKDAFLKGLGIIDTICRKENSIED